MRKMFRKYFGDNDDFTDESTARNVRKKSEFNYERPLHYSLSGDNTENFT